MKWSDLHINAKYGGTSSNYRIAAHVPYMHECLLHSQAHNAALNLHDQLFSDSVNSGVCLWRRSTSVVP